MILIPPRIEPANGPGIATASAEMNPFRMEVRKLSLEKISCENRIMVNIAGAMARLNSVKVERSSARAVVSIRIIIMALIRLSPKIPNFSYFAMIHLRLINSINPANMVPIRGIGTNKMIKASAALIRAVDKVAPAIISVINTNGATPKLRMVPSKGIKSMVPMTIKEPML